jgi:predicted XRE-type DNA-binding protein
MKKNPHIGSSFDDFLEEEGVRAEVQARVLKKVIAWQISQAMKQKRLTKIEMAKRMHTSRSALNRLLDPDNNSVTLDTITRAAQTLGKRVQFDLVDVP